MTQQQEQRVYQQPADNGERETVVRSFGNILTWHNEIIQANPAKGCIGSD